MIPILPNGIMLRSGARGSKLAYRNSGGAYRTSNSGIHSRRRQAIVYQKLF